ncbi:MAG: outer membrane beta-barrel protein [Saprospiraceae bacterium]
MLNRLFLLVFLAVGLVFSANAQVSIGVSAGANRSFWSWYIKNIETDLEFDPGIGYRAAAVADWRISPLVGLRAELGYQVLRSSTGRKFTSPNDPDGAFGHFNERYHFWTGGLMANVTPFSEKRFYLLTGASVAKMAEAWNTTSVEGGPEPFLSTKPIDLTNYNRTQVFADFGAGLRFPTGEKGALFTEIRYQLALTNLSSHSNVDSGVNSLGLNVGYLFKL